MLISCGRWAGFVEEAAHENYFVRALCVMKPPTVKGWSMGFADNGTTQGVIDESGQATRNNYFIECVSVEPRTYQTAL